MEKYSMQWKRAKKSWIQDHIKNGEKIYKIHYIQNETEYSHGEYLSFKEAMEELRKSSFSGN